MTREDDPEKYDYYFKKFYDAFYDGETTKEAIESLNDEIAFHIKMGETWEHVELDLALHTDNKEVWMKLDRKLGYNDDHVLECCSNPPGTIHDPRFYP